MHISGIDVSHYQGDIDWRAVAASGVRFAFVKVTSGADDIDPRFRQNWAATAAAGLLSPSLLPTDLSCRRPGEAFSVPSSPWTSLLCHRRSTSKSPRGRPAALRAGIKTWLASGESTLGRKPVLYTDPSFWRANGSADFGAYALRLACYSDRPELPQGWQTWTFWQHSDTGQVRGIQGAVDLDYCAVAYEDLQRMRPSHGA